MVPRHRRNRGRERGAPYRRVRKPQRRARPSAAAAAAAGRSFRLPARGEFRGEVWSRRLVRRRTRRRIGRSGRRRRCASRAERATTAGSAAGGRDPTLGRANGGNDGCRAQLRAPSEKSRRVARISQRRTRRGDQPLTLAKTRCLPHPCDAASKFMNSALAGGVFAPSRGPSRPRYSDRSTTKVTPRARCRTLRHDARLNLHGRLSCPRTPDKLRDIERARPPRAPSSPESPRYSRNQCATVDLKRACDQKHLSSSGGCLATCSAVSFRCRRPSCRAARRRARARLHRRAMSMSSSFLFHVFMPGFPSVGRVPPDVAVFSVMSGYLGIISYLPLRASATREFRARPR